MKKIAIIGGVIAIGILLAGCQKTTPQTNIDNAESGTINQDSSEIANPPAPAEPTRPPQ